MSGKHSNLSVGKSPSQYDSQQVLKLVHDAVNQSLRVSSANTSVPSNYSRVDLTYNPQGSVTNAKFYGGIAEEVRYVTFRGEDGGDLNNTYFPLYSEYDESKYLVWYNVDGAGTAPNITGFINLEVPLVSNDDVRVVLMATQQVVSRIEDFNVSQLNNTQLKISNSRKGTTTDTTDTGGTGFTFETRQQGAEELIKVIDIPYDGIVKYIYNEQEKKFDVESVVVQGDVSADGGDTIAVSRHQEYRNITDETNFLAAGLSTSAYTQIWSYTATEDLRVRTLKVKADTFGLFRVKVNGGIKDYYRTTQFSPNCHFKFSEDLDLLDTQTLTVEYAPTRLRLNSYNFFFRAEAYTK